MRGGVQLNCDGKKIKRNRVDIGNQHSIVRKPVVRVNGGSITLGVDERD